MYKAALLLPFVLLVAGQNPCDSSTENLKCCERVVAANTIGVILALLGVTGVDSAVQVGQGCAGVTSVDCCVDSIAACCNRDGVNVNGMVVVNCASV